ncbi:MAG: hypothetical protein Q9211_005027 [Gyalolechia sp. 1 TL-2023]
MTTTPQTKSVTAATVPNPSTDHQSSRRSFFALTKPRKTPPQMSPTTPHIFLLPDELLLQIYSYLPFPELIFLRRAHPHFDHIFTSNNLLPAIPAPSKPRYIFPFKSENPPTIASDLPAFYDDDGDDDDKPLPGLRAILTLGEMGGSREMFYRDVRELKGVGALPAYA